MRNKDFSTKTDNRSYVQVVVEKVVSKPLKSPIGHSAWVSTAKVFVTNLHSIQTTPT